MLAQKKIKEKFAEVEKKIAEVEKDENENLDGESFTSEEWNYFKEEVTKQVSEGEKIIDFGKAMRNARYLAMLDRGFDDEEGITFTFEELEKFMHEVCKI